MALTPSLMLPLRTFAPSFQLKDVRSGQIISLDTMKSNRGLLVMFICNHCPYVQHIVTELIQLAHEFLSKGLSVVAVSSNDPEQYPEDGPAAMKVFAQKMKLQFPYCFDETQAVAHAYHAACTPDLFLFDGHLKLVYRGQFDDSRPGKNTPVTGHDLRQAVEALLAGRSISAEQKPSLGCNIKWKVPMKNQ